MGTSIFPSNVTGVTVETATSGALSGDGSSGNKLAVGVDGVTVTVNGSNQLVASGGGGGGGTHLIDLGVHTVAETNVDAVTLYTPSAGELILAVMVTDVTLPDAFALLVVDPLTGNTLWQTSGTTDVYDSVGGAGSGNGLLVGSGVTHALTLTNHPIVLGVTEGSTGRVASAWTANTAYSLSVLGLDPLVVAAGHLWDGGAGGTSGNTMPDFVGNIGGSVVDNDITWTDVGDLPTVGSMQFYALVGVPE